MLTAPSTKFQYATGLALDESLTRGLQLDDLIAINFTDDQGLSIGRLTQGLHLLDLVQPALNRRTVLLGESGIGKSIATAVLAKEMVRAALSSTGRLQLSGDCAAGTSRIEIDDPSSLGPGDVIVIDPLGAASEEVRVAETESDGSFVLAEPLAVDHFAGDVVVRDRGIPLIVDVSSWSSSPSQQSGQAPESEEVRALLRAIHRLGLERALTRYRSWNEPLLAIDVLRLLLGARWIIVLDDLDQALRDPAKRDGVLQDISALDLLQARNPELSILIVAQSREWDLRASSLQEILAPRTIRVSQVAEVDVSDTLGPQTYSSLSAQIRSDCRNTYILSIVAELSRLSTPAAKVSTLLYREFVDHRLRRAGIPTREKWIAGVSELALELEGSVAFRFTRQELEHVLATSGLADEYFGDQDRLYQDSLRSGVIVERDGGELSFAHSRLQTYLAGTRLGSLFDADFDAAGTMVAARGELLLDCLPAACAASRRPGRILKHARQHPPLPTNIILAAMFKVTRIQEPDDADLAELLADTLRMLIVTTEPEIREIELRLLSDEFGAEELLAECQKLFAFPRALTVPDPQVELFREDAVYDYRHAFSVMASMAEPGLAVEVHNAVIRTSPFHGVPTESDAQFMPKELAQGAIVFDYGALRSMQDVGHRALEACGEVILDRIYESSTEENGSAAWFFWTALSALLRAYPSGARRLLEDAASGSLWSFRRARKWSSPGPTAAAGIVMEACAAHSEQVLAVIPRWLASNGGLRVVALLVLVRLVDADKLPATTDLTEAITGALVGADDSELIYLLYLWRTMGSELSRETAESYLSSDNAQVRWAARQALMASGDPRELVGLCERWLSGLTGPTSDDVRRSERLGIAGVTISAARQFAQEDLRNTARNRLLQQTRSPALAEDDLIHASVAALADDYSGLYRRVLDSLVEPGPATRLQDVIELLLDVEREEVSNAIAGALARIQRANWQSRREILNFRFVERVRSSSLFDRIASSLLIECLVPAEFSWGLGKEDNPEWLARASASFPMSEDWRQVSDTLMLIAGREAQDLLSRAVLGAMLRRLERAEIERVLLEELADLLRAQGDEASGPRVLPLLRPDILRELLRTTPEATLHLLIDCLAGCLSEDTLERVRYLRGRWFTLGSLLEAPRIDVALRAWERVTLSIIDTIVELNLKPFSVGIRHCLKVPINRVRCAATMAVAALEGEDALELLEGLIEFAVGLDDQESRTLSGFEFRELGRTAVKALAEVGPSALALVSRKDVQAFAPTEAKRVLTVLHTDV